MNIKKVVKYQIMDSRMAIPIFYLAVLCILALGIVSVTNIGGESSMVGGLETAMIIFLFIVGMNSFRETFRMMMQNGVTRRTMFKGFILTSLIIAAGMSMINEILMLLGRTLASLEEGFIFMGSFEQIYGPRYVGNQGGLQMAAEGMLLLICTSVAVMMFGYFITVMYYRLNKSGKIIVSISVPLLLIVILPIADWRLTGGAINRGFGRLTVYAMGLHNGYNPYWGIVSSLIIFALFTGLSWMLVRKAVVKD